MTNKKVVLNFEPLVFHTLNALRPSNLSLEQYIKLIVASGLKIETKRMIKCKVCKSPMLALRSTKEFCSANCRLKSFRKK